MGPDFLLKALLIFNSTSTTRKCRLLPHSPHQQVSACMVTDWLSHLYVAPVLAFQNCLSVNIVTLQQCFSVKTFPFCVFSFYINLKYLFTCEEYSYSGPSCTLHVRFPAFHLHGSFKTIFLTEKNEFSYLKLLPLFHIRKSLLTTRFEKVSLVI